jgi:hypothetical protein
MDLDLCSFIGVVMLKLNVPMQKGILKIISNFEANTMIDVK